MTRTTKNQRSTKTESPPATKAPKQPEAVVPQPKRPEAKDPKAKPKGKLATLVEMLSRAEGTNLDAKVTATGWQAHSVRGSMSGSLKKAMGLTITSEETEAGRVYRISEGATA
jgi:hypothetical protein